MEIKHNKFQIVDESNDGTITQMIQELLIGTSLLIAIHKTTQPIIDLIWIAHIIKTLPRRHVKSVKIDAKKNLVDIEFFKT